MQITVSGLDIQVNKKNIKNMHLSVKPPLGNVVVSAPLLMTQKSIEDFVRLNIGWIKKQQEKQEDDSEGTWLLSTTMGSVFTKFVFICSKCGYKKESVFSVPPVAYCPECEKRKANRS